MRAITGCDAALSRRNRGAGRRRLTRLLAAALLAAAAIPSDVVAQALAPAGTGEPASTVRPLLRPTVNPEGPGRVAADLPPADRMAPREPDLRLDADRDAFANPPAGYDPRYFRIEPVPREDRRIRDLYEIDPYEQLGWRLGAFILFAELELAAGWDSNVFYEPAARDDALFAVRSEMRLVSTWDNHALEFRMLNGMGYYADFPDQNDAGRTYEVRGRLDVRRSTTLEAVAGRDITREAANAIDAVTAGAGRADVTTDRATLAASHRFNRLGLQLRGGLETTRYEDGATTFSRDVDRRTLTGRASWTFRPTLATFAELGYDRRDRAAPAATDGLDRSSAGSRLRAGLSFGETGALLRGEASLGYGRQRPDEATLPAVEAFLIDANLAWRITPLTALLFTAETTLDETSVAGASAAVARRAGLGVRHAFRRHLIGEGGVTYAVQNYRGSALEENELTFRARAEYTASRYATLFAEARHIRFRSNEPGRDYNADELRLGVRLRN